MGTEEVELNDAYLISGIDGRRLNLKLSAIDSKGTFALGIPSKSNPLPVGTTITLLSDDFGGGTGISEAEFLAEWGSIVLIAEYSGKKHRVPFDQKSIKESLRLQYPHASVHD
jgi:hypothetical protein